MYFLNRYKREKSRLDPKDKIDKYAHNDYSSRADDNKKTYDQKRDYKRNVNIFYLNCIHLI